MNFQCDVFNQNILMNFGANVHTFNEMTNNILMIIQPAL